LHASAVELTPPGEASVVRVLIALDDHFVRDRESRVYVGHPFAIAGYAFWEPYLGVFDEILVLARVQQRTAPSRNTLQAGGPRVSFHDLPDFLGPWQYARELSRLRQEVQLAVDAADAFILRVPGTIGHLAWRALRRSGRPVGLEVIADPWDMYSPGAVQSIVRPVVRHRWSALLREMCRQAPCVLYVTREALQKRYPPGPRGWSTFASDVDIRGGVADASIVENRIRRFAERSSNNEITSGGPRIGFVGAFAQTYKAPDILLRAAATCYQSGLKFTVDFVGDGKYRVPMEHLANKLGLSGCVHFLGSFAPGRAVQEFLDEVDLFVLPSRQEGLPRAMVEAMARGCPCIGSTVGGIPELLPPEDLVPPDDVGALARKLREVLTDKVRLERMIHRSLERAREFQPEVLVRRRLDFYDRVREETTGPLSHSGT
jgi:glycosyltransferase involved in cell wall biosynthesis